MTRKGGAWRRERDTDPFVREARRRGLRSRAALKLEAMDARDHLFRGARVVVDLGAAPGGWSQVARRALPPDGRVVALDVLKMEELPGVEFIQGDFRRAEVLRRLHSSIGLRTADLVLSDMAPNLSGMRVHDQARWRELAEYAAEFSADVLKRDGVFLVKLFQGEETAPYLRMLRERFANVTVRKPAASRRQSSESYALARGVERFATHG
ncbi:MAG: RlmE family RNA methyltransferase [Chromatiales bacterium]|nr:RlmE family RNA methyltransferase [Chromatiales bacterium]